MLVNVKYFCYTDLLPIKDMDRELSPDTILPAHDMGKVQLDLSFHQKWIASAASDGKLFLRLIENPVSDQKCV